MKNVRLVEMTQTRITVLTEYDETLHLQIVAENGGVYAVNYTEDENRKAGLFAEEQAELYDQKEYDTFESFDSSYEVTRTDNAGSLAWVSSSGE